MGRTATRRGSVRRGVVTFLVTAVAGMWPVPAAAHDGQVAPPVAVSVSPAAVDVSEQAADVVVDVELSGANPDDRVTVRFSSPSGSHQSSWDPSEPRDDSDGIHFSVPIIIPVHSEPGVWSLTELSVDHGSGEPDRYDQRALEEAGIQATIDVTSATPDFEVPELVTADVSPSWVPRPPATITTRVRLRDAVSGVDRAVMYWVGWVDGRQGSVLQAHLELVSGDEHDGVWEASATVGTDIEPGTLFARPYLVDRTGNGRLLHDSQVHGAGHPTDVHVGDLLVPSEPHFAVATAGDESATVSWTAARFDGGTPITGYVITATPGAATAATDAEARSAVVGGLDNGTAYTFTVAAVNDVGTGEPSGRTRAVRATATPDAPDVTPPKLTDLEITRPHVDIADPDRRVPVRVGYYDDASGYFDEISATNHPSIRVEDPSGNEVPTATAFTPVSGHELEGVYEFAAVLGDDATEGTYTITDVTLTDNADNVAHYSGEQLALAGHPTTFEVYRLRAPGPVSEVTGSARPDGVTVTWEAVPPETDAPVTGYRVWRDGDVLAELDADTTSWFDANVDEGAAYTYAVAAVNSAGTGDPAEVTVTALARPSSPTDLSSSVEAGSVTLDWQPPLDDGGTPVTGYRVLRDGEEVARVDATTLTLVDDQIDEGVEYSYSVTAHNDVGAGPAAAVVVRTLAGPTAPTAVDAVPGPGVGDVTVRWQPPQSDGGTQISGYRIYREGALVAEVDAGQVSFVDGGRSPLSGHRYRVTAVNAVAEGAPSDEACSAAGPWPAAVTPAFCS